MACCSLDGGGRKRVVGSRCAVVESREALKAPLMWMHTEPEKRSWVHKAAWNCDLWLQCEVSSRQLTPWKPDWVRPALSFSSLKPHMWSLSWRRKKTGNLTSQGQGQMKLFVCQLMWNHHVSVCPGHVSDATKSGDVKREDSSSSSLPLHLLSVSPLRLTQRTAPPPPPAGESGFLHLSGNFCILTNKKGWMQSYDFADWESVSQSNRSGSILFCVQLQKQWTSTNKYNNMKYSIAEVFTLCKNIPCLLQSCCVP